jgi:hypothetical protein
MDSSHLIVIVAARVSFINGWHGRKQFAQLFAMLQALEGVFNALGCPGYG